MLGQNGFGYDSPKTSGLGKAKNCRDEMDNENEQIAHYSSYCRQKPPNFRSKLEFAMDTVLVASPVSKREFAKPAISTASRLMATLREAGR